MWNAYEKLDIKEAQEEEEKIFNRSVFIELDSVPSELCPLKNL